jgi:hypothetical protein
MLTYFSGANNSGFAHALASHTRLQLRVRCLADERGICDTYSRQ